MSERVDGGQAGFSWQRHYVGEPAWLLRDHEGDIVGEVIERRVPRFEGEVIRWVPYGRDGEQIHAGTHSAIPARRDVEERVGLIAGSVPVTVDPQALRVELARIDADLREVGRRHTELAARRSAIIAELVAPALAAFAADRDAAGADGETRSGGGADTPRGVG